MFVKLRRKTAQPDFGDTEFVNVPALLSRAMCKNPREGIDPNSTMRRREKWRIQFAWAKKRYEAQSKACPNLGRECIK
jgi:hypothetical protein